MKLPKFFRRSDAESLIMGEKLITFNKLLTAANDTIINKARKCTIRVSYLHGQELKRSAIIQLNKGFLSFRENDELYQFKYFGLKKSEDEVFDINKSTFDKYWNLAFSKNAHMIQRFPPKNLVS